MSIQKFLIIWLACIAMSALLATAITCFLVEEERARLSVKIAVPVWDFQLKIENGTIYSNTNGSWVPITKGPIYLENGTSWHP